MEFREHMNTSHRQLFMFTKLADHQNCFQVSLLRWLVAEAHCRNEVVNGPLLQYIQVLTQGTVPVDSWLGGVGHSRL